MAAYSFLDPILEPRLEEEEKDPDLASMFFITVALTFCISCHITPYFSNKLGHKNTLQLGIIMLGIFTTMWGPFPLFYIPSQVWVSLAPMLIVGFFEGLAMVPVVPEIMRIHS